MMEMNDDIEKFKLNFGIQTDISDIVFQKISIVPYETSKNHQFGEKKCLLYKVDITCFNIPINLRILAFKYERHSEVLKLEIKTRHEHFMKEFISCKNYLQRKRNVNLALSLITKFAKLYETRRLVCQVVFSKEDNISIKLVDNGASIKFNKGSLSLLEMNWNITWKMEQLEIDDFIEFYLNASALSKDLATTIKEKLHELVMPDISFRNKIGLWKIITTALYGVKKVKTGSSRIPNIQVPKDVYEISDSEDEISVIKTDEHIYIHSDECLIID